MTRNQKIALGCGGAGCLGLIVVVIAAALIYAFAYRTPTGRNYNLITNRNSNVDDNSNANSNNNSSSSTNSSTTASSMTEEDKHKLYQAAVMTGDGELARRVSVKIGLMNEDYTQGDNYNQFLAAHVAWVLRNGDFIQTINTTEKARAYVNQHFPE
ncbi:MAG TPA: hypothetical protein VN644_08930 [Pyrinomonadaceae bacterium]|jgi:hypothetical protein|nr:hypothetical protein [Pyrinomonadaceae bacterium]